MRTNYWTIGKFADWVRGTPSIEAGTSEEWRIWTRTAKAAHPVRYWIADTGFRRIQNTLYWPVDILSSIKYYINNRWISRSHSLTAHPKHIKPGEWRDVGNRFLPCLFNELVNFIEIETAGHMIGWGDDETREKYNSPFWASGWFRWRVWRCPQAGLDHLDWASKLTIGEDWGVDKDDENFGKLSSQAERAIEQLALYKWWTEVYPNRKDPHELSGWNDWCEVRRKKMTEQFPDEKDSMWLLDRGAETPEETTETRRILDLCNAIEQQQTQEDTEMMCRLIKIRDSLWT